MRSLTLASLLVFISIVFALPSFASAQGTTDGMGFAISPVAVADPAVTASGYFIYKVQGGGTITNTALGTATGSVLLKNSSSETLTIQLAGVDALTAQTGGTAFATADVPPSGAATWLKFAQSSVALPAGRQKTVDFTVTVPQGLRPAQYLAGISAYIPSPTSPAGGSKDGTSMGASVTMQTRYVIGVEVDLQGAWTPSLKIPSVALIQQPSGPFIGIHLNNDGDIFLKPSGTIVMTDTAGKRVLDQPIKLGTFVPGTEVTYPVHWSGAMSPGTYHVHVSLNYDKTGLAVYDSQLEIISAAAIQGTQNTSGATAVPGTIGNGNPVAAGTSVPANPVVVQVQSQSGVWLWVLAGVATLFLAAAALLTLNRGKTRRLQPEGKAV